MPGSDRDLDRLVHEPARLAILSHLYVVEAAAAPWLLQQTGLSWGNLSSHMSRLEAAGYLAVEKDFVDRKPVTMLTLTKSGRAAFRAYRKQIRKLLDGPG
ncbi:MAG TPA: transcriptional regulator [Planctomycetota bacterium]